MTIIRPAQFQTSLRAAAPVPESGQLEIEEALRRLAAMLERDPRTRHVESARRNLRSTRRFGSTTACVGS